MSFDDLRSLIDERLDRSNINLTSAQVLGLAGLAILLVLGGSLYYFWNRPSAVKQDFYATKSEKPLLKSKTTGPKKKVIVHVCGAVVDPGVLELEEGDRVVNALDLSGGATGEANLDALNLAAKLTDGQKIYVPKKGEQVSGEQATASNTGIDESSLVSINTATVEQLDAALPGVGPVLAQRIVDYRTAKGNFSAVEQLRNVEGIGPKKFEQIKTKVTVD